MNTNHPTEVKKNNAINVILAIACILLFLLMLSLSLLFFNYYDLKILTFLGWLLIIISFMTGGKASTDLYFGKKEIKSKKAIQRTFPFKRGIFGVIRHPIYGSFILIVTGLMMLTQYWVSLIPGIVLILLLYLTMLREEEIKLAELGTTYKAYMKIVPRLNFFRKLKRKKKH